MSIFLSSSSDSFSFAFMNVVILVCIVLYETVHIFALLIGLLQYIVGQSEGFKSFRSCSISYNSHRRVGRAGGGWICVAEWYHPQLDKHNKCLFDDKPPLNVYFFKTKYFDI